jgi:hypothetical protein
MNFTPKFSYYDFIEFKISLNNTIRSIRINRYTQSYNCDGDINYEHSEFLMIGVAYINLTAYGNLQGINKWVWILSHVIASE